MLPVYQEGPHVGICEDARLCDQQAKGQGPVLLTRELWQIKNEEWWLPEH